MEKIKTFILMFALIWLFMYAGEALAGQTGRNAAFIMACGINLYSYFFSDALVLKHYRAQKVSPSSVLYQTVAKLAENAGLPMPKVYIIEDDVPNAFATGRNPEHAAVAATQGLLQLVNQQELEGVLAHELGHIKHYDILISSVAAVFASAIAMLANIGRYQDNQNRRGILAVILLPIAATLIQMSVSRNREYAADARSAVLTKHPEWLVSALQKLEAYSKQKPVKNSTPQTAHIFTVDPLKNISGLFSTHPSTADRIKRLQAIKQKLEQ